MSFNLKDHLPKSVSDAIFEEEPQAAPAQHTPISINIPNAATTFSGIPYTTPSPVVENPLLSQLRTRTSFEATPIGQQLQGFMNDLADSGLQEPQKTKTALKLSHIPAASVIDALTGLQTVLAADKDKFDAQMVTASNQEIAGRQQKMANVDSQINDLESQLNTLRNTKSTLASEIEAKTHQIQSLKDNYKSAFDIRSEEIATQISHYQSILQG